MDRTTQRAYVGVSITAAAVAIAHLTLSVGARNPQSIPERFAIAFDLLSQLPLATVVGPARLPACLCTRRARPHHSTPQRSRCCHPLSLPLRTRRC